MCDGKKRPNKKLEFLGAFIPSAGKRRPYGKIGFLFMTGLLLLGCLVPARAQFMPSGSGELFSEDFDLKSSSSLHWTLDKEMQPVSMVVKDNVYLHLRGEGLKLYADTLTYKMAENQIVALGTPVRIVRENITATCKRFELYPDLGKSVLLGDPEITQQSEDGAPSKLRGEKITIIQKDDGTVEFFVDGGADLKGRNTKTGETNVLTGRRRPYNPTAPAQIEIENVEEKMEQGEEGLLAPLPEREEPAPFEEAVDEE